MKTLTEKFEKLLKDENLKEKKFDISDYKEYLQELDNVGLRKVPEYTLPVNVINFGSKYQNL